MRRKRATPSSPRMTLSCGCRVCCGREGSQAARPSKCGEVCSVPVGKEQGGVQAPCCPRGGRGAGSHSLSSPPVPSGSWLPPIGEALREGMQQVAGAGGCLTHTDQRVHIMGRD